jgi:hypothetical protein
MTLRIGYLVGYRRTILRVECAVVSWSCGEMVGLDRAFGEGIHALTTAPASATIKPSDHKPWVTPTIPWCDGAGVPARDGCRLAKADPALTRRWLFDPRSRR